MNSKSNQSPSQEYLEGVADGIYSYEDRNTNWPLHLVYYWRGQSEEWSRGFQKGLGQRSAPPKIVPRTIENNPYRTVLSSPTRAVLVLPPPGDETEPQVLDHISGLA